MEQFEIVAGTYEEFLLGYKFLLNSPALTQSFASHDHSSSIRAVATSDHYLASGATDDRIIIYDLKTRKEHCMLTHHNSTITCIQFTNNHSHIISGSADGVLAIVRVGNWQLEKLWDNAHNGKPILDIAIHPSGKLALTLGADASLRTWNLIKGRQAYIINLSGKSKDARNLEKIIWAEDETRFILYGGKYTEIWSIETGGMLKSIEHPSKVCSCIWYNDKEIIVGYENGQIARLNTETDSKHVHDAHDVRVKCLAKFKKWIVSASSSGEIKVWNKHFELHASANAGCRITCLLIAKIIQVKKVDEEQDVEVKEEPIEKPIQTKSIVVIEYENSDDENTNRQLKKQKNKKKTNGQFNKIETIGESMKDNNQNIDVKFGKMDRQVEENTKQSKKKKNNMGHANTTIEDTTKKAKKRKNIDFDNVDTTVKEKKKKKKYEDFDIVDTANEESIKNNEDSDVEKTVECSKMKNKKRTDDNIGDRDTKIGESISKKKNKKSDKQKHMNKGDAEQDSLIVMHKKKSKKNKNRTSGNT